MELKQSMYKTASAQLRRPSPQKDTIQHGVMHSSIGPKVPESTKSLKSASSPHTFRPNNQSSTSANTTMSKGGDSTSQSKKPLNNSHIENVCHHHSVKYQID